MLCGAFGQVLHKNGSLAVTAAGGEPPPLHRIRLGVPSRLPPASARSSATGSSEGSLLKAARKANHIVVEDGGLRLSFVARKGVYYDKRRRLWRANWKENGRIHTKGFSVHGQYVCDSASRCFAASPFLLACYCAASLK